MGLGANWTTALTDSVALSVGVTYDYYTVSGADAKTYLNSTYYTDIYDALLQDWIDAGKTEADMLDPDSGESVAQDIKQIEAVTGATVSSNRFIILVNALKENMQTGDTTEKVVVTAEA